MRRIINTIRFCGSLLLLLCLKPDMAGAATDQDGLVKFNGITGLDHKRAVYTLNEHPSLAFSIIQLGNKWTGQALCTAEINDMWNRPVYTTTIPLKISADSIAFTLTPALEKTGWYYVKLDITCNGKKLKLKRYMPTSETDRAKGISQFPYPMFAIVPPVSNKVNNATPIGLDIGISAIKSKKEVAAQIELAALTGVKWVRDRAAWQIMEKAPNQYNIDTYLQNAGKLYAQGIHTLMVFQSVPAWAKSANSLTFPDDLRMAYDFAKNAGKALYPGVSAWELWNEHDIAAFNREPPDQYAAVLKAMALGYKSLNERPTVLLGPFARDPNVGGYGEVLFENLITPFLDVYSFHTYAPANTELFGKVIDTHLQMMRSGGLTREKPWLSETGAGFKKNMSPAVSEARDKQLTQLLWAFPQAMEKGVGKVFWFLLRTYYGAEVQFATVDENDEPLPVYSAFAAINYQLANYSYDSKRLINGLPVFFFRHGNNVRAMVLSKSVETEINDATITTQSAFTDVMGNPLNIKVKNHKATVKNNGWPFYINNVAVVGAIPTPAVVSPGKQPVPEVIIRVRFPAGNIVNEDTQALQNWDGLASKWAPRGYRYKQGDSITAKIEVYNFSSKVFRGSIETSLPDNIKTTGLPNTVEISPGERLELTCLITTGQHAVSNGRWIFKLKDQAGAVGDVAVSKWTFGDSK